LFTNDFLIAKDPEPIKKVAKFLKKTLEDNFYDENEFAAFKKVIKNKPISLENKFDDEDEFVEVITKKKGTKISHDDVKLEAQMVVEVERPINMENDGATECVELTALAEEMWNNDNNALNSGSDFELDIQGKTRYSKAGIDNADDPLFI